jgi:hypothetical protein
MWRKFLQKKREPKKEVPRPSMSYVDVWEKGRKILEDLEKEMKGLEK